MDDELPLLSTSEIADRYRLPHDEVLSWVDPGVDTPRGTVRLRAGRVQGLPGIRVVRPEDLVRFIRARYGLPEPEFAR